MYMYVSFICGYSIATVYLWQGCCSADSHHQSLTTADWPLCHEPLCYQPAQQQNIKSSFLKSKAQNFKHIKKN